MPIKPEEALEVLGVDPAKFENVDALKESFEGDWVKRATAKDDPQVRKDVLGKVQSNARHKLKKYAETYGLEIELKDDVDMLDAIPRFGDALKDKFTELEELRTKSKDALPADVKAQLDKQLKSLEKERDTFKSQAVEWQGKHDTLFADIGKSRLQAAEDAEWNAALGGVQFHQGVDDLKKEGFKAVSRSKYKLQFDEQMKPKLVDASGNPIKNPKKAGELLTLSEAIKFDAAALKLEANNPRANVPAPVQTEKRTVTFSDNDTPGAKRPANPRERTYARPLLGR